MENDSLGHQPQDTITGGGLGKDKAIGSGASPTPHPSMSFVPTPSLEVMKKSRSWTPLHSQTNKMPHAKKVTLAFIYNFIMNAKRNQNEIASDSIPWRVIQIHTSLIGAEREGKALLI